jgi:hypothetical protein
MKKCIQGSNAYMAGKALENTVEKILGIQGVGSIEYKDWVTNNWIEMARVSGAPGLLVKNFPYTNIYGRPGRSEFVLVVDDYENIRIECRSQRVPGSASDKFPYLFLNGEACDEKVVIFVVDGVGFKKGSVEWLKSQAIAVKHKAMVVMDLDEFKEFVKTFFSGQKAQRNA